MRPGMTLKWLEFAIKGHVCSHDHLRLDKASRQEFEAAKTRGWCVVRGWGKAAQALENAHYLWCELSNKFRLLVRAKKTSVIFRVDTDTSMEPWFGYGQLDREDSDTLYRLICGYRKKRGWCSWGLAGLSFDAVPGSEQEVFSKVTEFYESKREKYKKLYEASHRMI